MVIHVSSYGSSLGKKSERLVVREKGRVVEEIPFFKIEQVIVDCGGVSISTDVLHECMKNGIQVNLLKFNGEPYAKIVSPLLDGTVKTRREQLLAYNDERGVYLACCFAGGKIMSQANTLKYFGKYRKSTDLALYDRLMQAAEKMQAAAGEVKNINGTNIDEVRGRILAIEGRAADLYWQQVKALLEDKLDFPGREHRGAKDPVNSMLNYGYAVLYSQVQGAILLAGLEPFGGFLHADRSGRPSLVLDLIEEFRQPVVDRALLGMLGKGYQPEMDEHGLTQETRRELVRKIEERLDSQEQYAGKKHKLRNIIQQQARHMATYLRGEGNYRPFVCGW